MQVFVKDNKTHVIEVSPDAYVAEVKHIIKDKLGVCAGVGAGR